MQEILAPYSVFYTIARNDELFLKPSQKIENPKNGIVPPLLFENISPSSRLLIN